jgi:hypothetical protein
VYANRKRWQANIRYNRKRHHLGIFDTKQEAALAYDRAARQCGEEKLLNYESIVAAEEAAVKAQPEYNLVHPKLPKSRPASGFYGVYASGKRWQAHICYDNKKHTLGSFGTKQEAALAYDREARRKDKLLNYESIKAAEEAAVQAAEAAVQAEAEHILVHDMCAGPLQPKPRPASGFYGVSTHGKRWAARINYGSKNHNLGIFDTRQEAALAYDKAARQCRKDTLLNYESIKAAEEAAVQAQAEVFAEALCAGPKQRKPRPASGFYGVYANGKRWQATICYDGKKHNLGYFDTKQETALAYDREARQCGEDKLLNYESIKAAEEAAVQAQSEICR